MGELSREVSLHAAERNLHGLVQVVCRCVHFCSNNLKILMILLHRGSEVGQLFLLLCQSSTSVLEPRMIGGLMGLEFFHVRLQLVHTPGVH